MMARTTQVKERGVAHPATAALSCTMNGVFAFRFLRWLDIKHFDFADRAAFLGLIDEDTFRRVLTEWERR